MLEIYNIMLEMNHKKLEKNNNVAMSGPRKKELYRTAGALVTITGALIILAGVLWVNGYTIGFMSRFRVTVACAVFMGVFTVMYVRKYKDLKRGEPLEDERSHKIKMYAAGYTFFSAPFWFVVMLFKDYVTNEQVIGFSLVGLWVIFGGWWVYLRKRGDVHE